MLVFGTVTASAETVSDNFDDGVIDPMWIVDNGALGLSVTEEGGCLNISGLADQPAAWLGGNIWNLLYDGAHQVDVQMKFKVPVATDMSNICISITGPSGSAQVEYNTLGGYAIGCNSMSGWQWSSRTPAKGNEATTYNLLKLSYDPLSNTATAYVGDADGSNQQFIGSFNIELVPVGLPNPKLGVAIQYWTLLYAAVDIDVDDFSVSAMPYPELVPPPLALGVSLGQRQELQPDDAEILCPAFSNDGKKIAYLLREGAPEAGVWNIYVKELTADSPAYRITEDSDWAAVTACLSWSPNDRRIFFLTDSPDRTRRVRYVDATPTTDRVSHPYLTEFDGGISWFFDIDFSRNTEHQAAYVLNGDVFAFSVDDFGDPLPGATHRKLLDMIDLQTIPRWLRWSPDGTKITCGYGFNMHSFAIWIVDVANLPLGEMVLDENSPYVTIVTDTRNFAAVPAFSYDGRYVYYCADLNNVFNPGTYGWNRFNTTEVMLGDADFDIFVAKADGSAPPERLTAAPLSQGIFTVSPDGTLLAYNTDDDTDGDGVREGDVYLFNLVISEPVDASGGEVSDGSGTTVTVPQDALTEPVTVTIETPLPGSEPPLDTLPAGTSLALAREFGPDGLVFAAPVKIEINYTDEEVAGLDEANLQIYWYDDINSTWEALTSDSDCTDPATNVVCAWVTHFSTFGVLDVPTLMAGAELEPPSLNVKSKGQYVTAYIELPAGFHPSSIDVGQIMLNQAISALAAPTAIGDHDADGILDLMVKFDRAAVQASLPLGWAPVTISGCLTNGVPFEDTLSVYVFDKGMGHYNDSRPDSIVE